MRKGLAFAIIAVALAFGVRVDAERLSWINPSTYSDGTAIPDAKKAALSTEIEYKIGAGTYAPYATATGGVSTYMGTNLVTPGGGTSTWRIRTVSTLDNNSKSGYSNEVTATRPFQATDPARLQDVQFQ